VKRLHGANSLAKPGQIGAGRRIGSRQIEGGHLHSLVNGKSHGIGEFELPSLRTLRERAASQTGTPGRLKVSVVTGDVREMHQAPEYAGALVQPHLDQEP
jgi:hypothetical protein